MEDGDGAKKDLDNGETITMTMNLLIKNPKLKIFQSLNKSLK
jgi:hypothetical protein